jgi:hypothetical protein
MIISINILKIFIFLLPVFMILSVSRELRLHKLIAHFGINYIYVLCTLSIYAVFGKYIARMQISVDVIVLLSSVLLGWLFGYILFVTIVPMPRY